jgi:hypothetical protein
MSEELLKEMSAQFPSLTFRLEFAEIGCMYVGWKQITSGILTGHEWNLTDKDFSQNEDDDNDEYGPSYKHDDEYAELVESSG